MERNCKSCKKFLTCKKHDFVLIHKRPNSGFYFIVAFDDDFESLIKLRNHLPDYGKNNHDFYIVSNRSDSRISSIVNDIKDSCLLNICENVAYALSRAEYSMLKKKYSRSKLCFDRAKSMIAVACYILENY